MALELSNKLVAGLLARLWKNSNLLKIQSSSLKVMVPFHNVNTVGLRRVVKNGEIQKIVDFLTDGECDNNADWKYRFKENSERDADRIIVGGSRRPQGVS